MSTLILQEVDITDESVSNLLTRYRQFKGISLTDAEARKIILNNTDLYSQRVIVPEEAQSLLDGIHYNARHIAIAVLLSFGLVWIGNLDKAFGFSKVIAVGLSLYALFRWFVFALTAINYLEQRGKCRVVAYLICPIVLPVVFELMFASIFLGDFDVLLRRFRDLAWGLGLFGGISIWNLVILIGILVAGHIQGASPGLMAPLRQHAVLSPFAFWYLSGFEEVLTGSSNTLVVSIYGSFVWVLGIILGLESRRKRRLDVP